MAKSIRSKIKRKHRAEFRRTFGNDAYKINMAKVQANLSESIEKQSMKVASLEKLTNALATDSEPLASGMDEDISKAAIDAVPEVDPRGENKVIVSKSARGRKYSVRKAIHQKQAETKQATPKHRYHCEF